MKVTTIAILLVCYSCVVRADDLATPTPTPIYYNHLAPPGTLRRAEQLDRQRALQTDAQTKAQAREQTKANRRATAAAQAQAHTTARDKERAQHQVDAEARREAAKESPKTTSDLMKQMGFSDEEVAAQKAREEGPKPRTKGTTASQAEHHQDQSKPANASSATGDKSASASPAP